MEIRPILSSLLRNKTGALLIALQVALTLAIVSNALYIVKERMASTDRRGTCRGSSSEVPAPLRGGVGRPMMAVDPRDGRIGRCSSAASTTSRS